MQAINIRNISLSLCLGIFSFQTYVANIHSVGTNSRDLATVADAEQNNPIVQRTTVHPAIAALSAQEELGANAGSPLNNVIPETQVSTGPTTRPTLGTNRSDQLAAAAAAAESALELGANAGSPLNLVLPSTGHAYNYPQRNPAPAQASVAPNCKSRGFVLADFRNPDYHPDSCEVKVDLVPNAEEGTFSITMTLRLQEETLVKQVVLTDLEFEGGTNEAREIPEVAAALTEFEDVHYPAMFLEITEAASASPSEEDPEEVVTSVDPANAAAIDGDSDSTNIITPEEVSDGELPAVTGEETTVTDNPQAVDEGAATTEVETDETATVTVDSNGMTPPDQAAGAFEPEEFDAERIKAIFERLDELQEKNESCDLANTEDFDEILSSNDNIIERRESDFKQLRTRDLEKLQERDLERIWDLEAALAPFSGEDTSSDLDSQITCLSNKALQENGSENQLGYYLLHIRPLVISNAIDNNTSVDDQSFTVLTQNAGFIILQENNSLITQTVEVEKVFAGMYANCSTQTDKTQCTQEFKDKITTLNAQTSDDSNQVLLKETAVAIGSQWFSKLTDEPVGTDPDSGDGTDGILDGVRNGNAATDGIDLQKRVLETTKALVGDIDISAKAGSNARGSAQSVIIGPTNSSGVQQNVHRLDEDVTRGQLNYNSVQ